MYVCRYKAFTSQRTRVECFVGCCGISKYGILKIESQLKNIFMLYVHTHTNTRKHTHANAHTQTHTSKHTQANTHTQTLTSNSQANTHKQIHVQTHTRTHTHTRANTYTKIKFVDRLSDGGRHLLV